MAAPQSLNLEIAEESEEALLTPTSAHADGRLRRYGRYAFPVVLLSGLAVAVYKSVPAGRTLRRGSLQHTTGLSWVAPDSWCEVETGDTHSAGLIENLKQHVSKTMQSYATHAPAYTNLVATTDEYLCSVVKSVYNVNYPPNAPQDVMPDAPAYFQQADRASCSIAAVAAAISATQPTDMVTYLMELYFTGAISSSPTPLPKVDEYILSRSPTGDQSPDPKWKQYGPIFVWTTALRSDRNKAILATYHPPSAALVEHAKIQQTPEAGDSTQNTGGQNYLAMPGDVRAWCAELMGGECTSVQGACQTKDCINMFDNLLPAEVADLKAWYAEGGKVAYKGWSSAVKKLTERPTIMSDVVTFFTRLPADKLNGPAFIQIAGTLLEACYNEDPSTCEALQTKGYCRAKMPFCIPDHWVYLHSCDDRDMCYIWSWGVLYTVAKKDLAQVTPTWIKADFS